MVRRTKALVVAGTHSGVGKTTVSLALMAAFRRSGRRIQAFKVGPDFIDPGHHAAITGRPSQNLDGWMLDRAENLRIFSSHVDSADLAVVEGVMGLYDGRDGATESGSTAEMAKWLGLPVLLCVDARSQARSMAALAQGFGRFDPDLCWVGLLANRVGGPRHVEMLAAAMKSVPELPFWGGLTRTEEIALPERHLGLVTAEESSWDRSRVDRLINWIEAGLDLEALWDQLPEVDLHVPDRDDPAGSAWGDPPVRIGVPRDEAFCFYYQENLRRLRAAGAELVFFSPLRDEHLPGGLHGLYIGGGYPELFAPDLARNRGLLTEIRDLGLAGWPVYAECGGLIFLGRTLADLDGRSWPMAGLLPMESTMGPRLRSLGYREVTFARDTPLGRAGLVARGHEFHYSDIARSDQPATAYHLANAGGQPLPPEGFMIRNVLASYIHLHFGSQPALAPNLVAACLARIEARREV